MRALNILGTMQEITPSTSICLSKNPLVIKLPTMFTRMAVATVAVVVAVAVAGAAAGVDIYHSIQ